MCIVNRLLISLCFPIEISEYLIEISQYTPFPSCVLIIQRLIMQTLNQHHQFLDRVSSLVMSRLHKETL